MLSWKTILKRRSEHVSHPDAVLTEAYRDMTGEQDEEMTSGDEEGMNGELALASEDLEDEDDLLEDGSDDDMALNLAGDDGAHQGLPDIQVVQMRIASATRALSDWRIHGKKTGKSRSEIYDQFIEDICSYYGYNKFLAEKLVDLFSVDEVSGHTFCQRSLLA